MDFKSYNWLTIWYDHYSIYYTNKKHWHWSALHLVDLHRRDENSFSTMRVLPSTDTTFSTWWPPWLSRTACQAINAECKSGKTVSQPWRQRNRGISLPWRKRSTSRLPMSRKENEQEQERERKLENASLETEQKKKSETKSETQLVARVGHYRIVQRYVSWCCAALEKESEQVNNKEQVGKPAVKQIKPPEKALCEKFSKPKGTRSMRLQKRFRAAQDDVRAVSCVFWTISTNGIVYFFSRQTGTHCHGFSLSFTLVDFLLRFAGLLAS